MSETLKKSSCKIDEHRSYPYAVAEINGEHIVVNHEIGFKNPEGFHTNLIEGEWALFSQISKQERECQDFLCLDIFKNIYEDEGI